VTEAGALTGTVDLTILMPVFNERNTVEDAVRSALTVELPVERVELVIVDDGSTDGTSELLDGHRWPDHVRVLRHHRNLGKGAAVRTGLREARGTFTTILDADLEYDPADIAQMLVPLLKNDAEVVYGARGFQSHSAYSFWYVLGNKAVTLVANVLYNSWVADIMTCHKIMRTDLFRSLHLTEQGFAMEPEITARLLRRGIRIYEVPVLYRARSRKAGKKLTGVDAVRVLWTLLRCRLF
jgi:glycosyltransferase involved in cell wall biosynthesis